MERGEGGRQKLRAGRKVFVRAKGRSGDHHDPNSTRSPSTLIMGTKKKKDERRPARNEGEGSFYFGRNEVWGMGIGIH